MNNTPATFVPLEPAPLWDTLLRALRDFIDARGFPGAFVSLSGGIDSALVATLAVDALGPSRVLSATYPSPYTSRETLSDALETARRLGIPCPVVPIEPAFRALADALPPEEAYPSAPPLPGNLVGENLQSRVRGVLNMALSNRHGHAVLCTGNRSEGLTGYCTLYGDTCGAFAPLRDVYKTEVFALARYRNARIPDAPPIPVSTIERPPSAELRPGQQDSDSLPPYPVLDAVLSAMVDGLPGPAAPLPDDDAVAAAADAPLSVVRRVRSLLLRSAFKRRQAPPGPPLRMLPELPV